MEAILDSTVKAIGWSIFHSLWQGAIIYGLLFIIMSALPKLPARYKHNLAFSGICMLFVVFCITFISILKLPTTNASDVVQAVPLKANHLSYLNVLPTSVYDQAEALFPYVVLLYAAGLLVQVSLIAFGYYKLNQLKNAYRGSVPDQWQQVFKNILSELKISKKVGFFLSEHVNVPLVIGYFKPVVLFPFALATQLDLKQVEAILIHELSHIRRNDYLLNLLKTGIETILFFNPFVWLSSRFIQIEREHACDDLVLGLTGTPLTYAHALLKLELLKVKDTPTFSLAASGNSQHLYQRIKRITDMKTNYMNPKQQIFAITFTVATIVSLAWVSPKEKTNIQTAVKLAIEQVKRVPVPDVVPVERKVEKVIQIKLPIDTPKKKKSVKIITVDEYGKRTEYKSIKELPDSIKADLEDERFFVHGLSGLTLDTNAIVALRKNAEAIALKFNSPEEKAKWEKLGLEMRKQGEVFEKRFNSPEEKAKWEKLGKEMGKQAELFQKKFNSPEEKAKWRKLGLDMQKQGELFEKKFNSPEEKAKWKKLGLEMEKQAEMLNKNMNSLEQQKKFKKLNEQLRLKSREMNKLMITPELQKELNELNTVTKDSN
jgi:bla regulator protein BlaR1